MLDFNFTLDLIFFLNLVSRSYIGFLSYAVSCFHWVQSQCHMCAMFIQTSYELEELLFYSIVVTLGILQNLTSQFSFYA